jgi:hypothetical protein
MKRLLVVNVLLLAVVVGLVVQIFALWWRAEAEIEQPAPRELGIRHIELPSAVRRPPPPDLAVSISEKDLFDPSRSPQQATAPAPEPAPPLNLALLGVTVAGGAREALIRDQAQPKPLWLREGEEFGGYKLSRIEPTSVVMIKPGGEEVELVINVTRAPTGAGSLGPAGIQPPPGARAQVMPVPAPTNTPRRPAADIREKIERLREEARQRRRQQRQQ